jgi:hypothetical protein
MLREHVQQLEQRVGSSAGDPAVRRSLSTMKREQTRVVRENEESYRGVDSLVHTDSGLRLTPGRVNELPPNYAAD